MDLTVYIMERFACDSGSVSIGSYYVMRRMQSMDDKVGLQC